MKQSLLLVIFEISMKMEVKTIFSVRFMLFILCMLLQSICHPTCALCDAPFMTYVNSYMFWHRGAILM